MNDVKWRDPDDCWDLWKAWCDGKTGYPIVDAGMRELLATGFMHNRVRMLVANLLVKNLHIDWRHGEKYFAQTLIDYDPIVNNGSWQWCASVGVDPQPCRIFNIWFQTKKFDAECKYIKKWVPELSAVPCSVIIDWDKEKIREGYVKRGIYMNPIVDFWSTIEYAKSNLSKGS